ncbi:tyrosine-type recombinase/integrase [Hymenobacter sp. BT664]|uniref:Tyrosine-type recombinase/integrase n=1 Tax=Hymenobacter montanus TaxID=2771359 RepID=A0A927BEH0_9BACT|nr:tyrosine-type recombinase/integrase [Hymenobacter montanus]
MKQKGKKANLPVAADSVPALTLADLSGQVAPDVARYLVRGLEGADNTRLAYATDLASFEAYCSELQLEPYPASVATLAGYVAYLADKPRKLATIHRHLAAIAKKHQLMGLPSAVDAPALNVLLKGVARELGKRQKQAPAFTVAQLKQALNTLDLETAAGLRDRALLLMGFAGAFRRSELVALDLEQIEMNDAALVVHLRSSKTNQAGETEDKALFYAATPRYCPVRAFLDWQRVLGRSSGPVFVSLVRGQKAGESKPSQKRLSDVRVNRLVKQHLGEQYSAHSLRASFITTAKLNGQSNEFIKNQTKQKTDAIISRYTRLSDVVAYNAAQSLGL